MKKNLFRYLLIIGICLLPFILRIPSWHFPLEHDVGGHLFYGMEVYRHGFYSTLQEIRPVGLLTIFSVIYRFFGNSTIWVNVIGSFFWILTTFFFYKLVLLLFKSEKLAIFSSLIFVFLSASRSMQGEMANLETFFIPFNLIGIYSFFLFKERKKTYLLIVSGFCFGTAFMIKQLALFDLAAVLFFNVMTQVFNGKNDERGKFKYKLLNLVKENIFVFLGFISPLIIYLIYFFLHHQLKDFLGYQFLAIYKNTKTTNQVGTALHNFKVSFSKVFTQTGIFWILALLGAVITTRFKKESKRYFLYLWLLIDFIGIYYLWWFFYHHFLQILPPISIFSGLFITDSLDFLNSSRKRYQKYLSIISLSIVFLFFVYFVKSDLIYFTSFYNEITGKIDRKTHLSLVGWDIGPAGLISIYDAGEYLNKVTQEDEKIFAWVPAPHVYIFSNREPITWFVYKYPLLPQEISFMVYKGWFNNYLDNRKVLMDDLNKNFPRYLVIEVNPERIFDEMLSFQDFSRFVSTNYLLDKQFGNYLIFVRRDQPKSLNGSSSVIPPEIIERYSQIISIKENGDINKIIFEPMVNTSGILRRLAADAPRDNIQITDLVVQGAEVKEDFVGFASDKPSGTPDLHVRVKGLSQPLSFARVKIGDFAWNSESYGVNPRIKVIQNGDLFDLYMEPIKMEGQKTIEIYFVYQNGELAKTSINIVP